MKNVSKPKCPLYTHSWLLGGIMVLPSLAGAMVDLDHPVAELLGISDKKDSCTNNNYLFCHILLLILKILS